MAADMVNHILQVGKGCYLYCCDFTCAYRQLPLDPCDWPLVCHKAQWHFFIVISLPFSLCWVAACCQDVTNLVVRVLREEDRVNPLAYINDFFGWWWWPGMRE